MQGYACDSRLEGWVAQVGGAQVASIQSWSVEGALVVHGGLVLVRYVSMHGSHADNEGWWQS